MSALWSAAGLPAHPEVRSLPPAAQRRLQGRFLARHLHLTEVLEEHVVVPVARRIRDDRPAGRWSASLRAAADRVVREETDHAQQAGRLRDRFGLARPTRPPAFVGRLGHAPGRPEWVALLFSICTETLVTTTLRAAARGDDLHPEVRGFLVGHARDEAHHAAIFAQVARELAAAVDVDDWGPELPQLLAHFVDPDLDAITEDLLEVGLSAHATQEVRRGLSTGSALRARRRRAARPTVAHLSRAGLLQGPTRHAFVTHGLVED